MSVIVAIKDKGRFVIGSDSQATIKSSSKDHNTVKIWPVKGLPGAILGSVGSCRASQIIQYYNIIDKNYLYEDLDAEYVVTVLIPAIVNTLNKNGIKTDFENADATYLPNSYIFAYRDKAWIILNDLSIMEIEDFYAIGSGREVANGVLFATKNNSNPFDRIVTAITAAADMTLYVDESINILTTGTCKDDTKRIAKAFKIDKKQIESKEITEVVDSKENLTKKEEEFETSDNIKDKKEDL